VEGSKRDIKDILLASVTVGVRVRVRAVLLTRSESRAGRVAK
jgi:hypothetical protein